MKKKILLCFMVVLFAVFLISCMIDYNAKSYKVTYDYNYGDKKITCYYLKGSSAFPYSPSRTGYIFDNWYLDEEFTKPFDFFTTLYKNVTLYAKWKEAATVLSSAGRTECGWVQLWFEDNNGDGINDAPKWAEFNVGATISDYASVTGTTNDEKYTTANAGGLYGWGGSETNCRKTDINPDYYSGNSFDDDGNLLPENDTATKLWGSNWKMPTKDDLFKLINEDGDNTTWLWCDGSTVQYVTGCTLKGHKVSGKGKYENNSIFLPAAGYCGLGILYETDQHENYWTSTYAESFPYNLVSDNYDDTMKRKYGLSVRPVIAE